MLRCEDCFHFIFRIVFSALSEAERFLVTLDKRWIWNLIYESIGEIKLVIDRVNESVALA